MFNWLEQLETSRGCHFPFYSHKEKEKKIVSHIFFFSLSHQSVNATSSITSSHSLSHTSHIQLKRTLQRHNQKGYPLCSFFSVAAH
ncbi:hypothetical protein RchiOBHm_Chr5g0080591 [Rosa chinensis]|uniref:Uncharacterized protein n=1 Tax=Rosa chinensis TaxID=74649 RepID=A0A2P6QMS8_ROSCH|nr:hypothetical protein RchiOBHm_Chr5g0080591 [Rosa chinensis]